jgi:hypothetical protein
MTTRNNRMQRRTLSAGKAARPSGQRTRATVNNRRFAPRKTARWNGRQLLLPLDEPPAADLDE